MRRRTQLAVPVLLTACALGLAGCGGGGDDNGGSNTTAATDTAATETSGTETTAAGDVTAGKDIFLANCGSCHTLADAGTTGSIGPNLDDLKPDQETVAHQVTNGGGAMPAFGGQLSEQDITNVAAYVSSVAGAS